MSLGVYFHIPYCLQKCTYCDFATYEINTVLAPDQYVELVKKEMQFRAPAIPQKEINSIYFGGGTPSLLKPTYIVSLIKELANLGFTLKKNIEITMEINPSIEFNNNLNSFLATGINRFSVGAQSFSDEHLKACGRKHSSQETTQTLALLKKLNLNFSLDILFALPHQTFEQVEKDVKIALSYNPKHISTYCLTVPEGHPMSFNRPKDQTQTDMFSLIKSQLELNKIYQYEISNFAKEGFRSQHNQTYWEDKPYWGIGLSSHSFFPDNDLRFWNPKSMGLYKKLIDSTESQLENLNAISTCLPAKNFEFLEAHEVITDFCHVNLRKTQGLSGVSLRDKFSPSQVTVISRRLDHLITEQLIELKKGHWVLTGKGLLLSNLVFEKLHFSKDDIS